MNDHRTGPRRIAVSAAVILLLAGMAGAAFAGGPAASQSAPKRPPESFPVFVQALETDDADRRALLAEAVSEVTKRIGRRRHWFRTVESREAARVTLRITNYRTVSEIALKRHGTFVRRGMVVSERSEIVELHYVDAVASAGEIRRDLSGLDRRRVGTSLRNASDHLAEELERFCRENYAALTETPLPEASLTETP